MALLVFVALDLRNELSIDRSIEIFVITHRRLVFAQEIRDGGGGGGEQSASVCRFSRCGGAGRTADILVGDRKSVV